MNKILLLLFAILFIEINSYSQDTIVKPDGEKVKVRVLDVGKKNIQYKNFDDPDFATYSIKLEQVAKINYEDGRKWVFSPKLPHYISLVYGFASPSGDFQEFDTNNPESGYAKTGNSFGLEAGFYIVKNFGIALSVGFHTNRFDTLRFSDPYRGSNLVKLDFSEDNSRWKTKHFMIGPFYSFKVGKKFALDLKFLVGAVSTVKPGFGMFYDNNSATPPFQAFYYYQDADGTGFGVNPGLAFRYNFSKRIGLRASMDLVAARVPLSNQVEINENNTQRVEDNSINTKIEMLRGNVGLVFLINR